MPTTHSFELVFGKDFIQARRMLVENGLKAALDAGFRLEFPSPITIEEDGPITNSLDEAVDFLSIHDGSIPLWFGKDDSVIFSVSGNGVIMLSVLYDLDVQRHRHFRDEVLKLNKILQAKLSPTSSSHFNDSDDKF